MKESYLQRKSHVRYMCKCVHSLKVKEIKRIERARAAVRNSLLNLSDIFNAKPPYTVTPR